MSSLSSGITRQAIRLDDPEIAKELACQNERANWIASRYGLPGIGSKMVNTYGIEWIVQSHAPVPTFDSLHRWRQGDVQPEQDLYPVIAPTNFSPKLTEFFHAIDRCTTKTFAILDTMPGRRNDGHIPGGNSIDTVCHAVTNIIFLDAARVNETVIAHELGHAWVQYVDQCEDLRTMEDCGDPQRMRHVGFVQSFVLDLKVNDLLRRKGFDMSPIEADQSQSIQQLAESLRRGYLPKHSHEEIFMALLVADQMIQCDAGRLNELATFDRALEIIRDHGLPLAQLADRLAGSVRRNGYASQGDVVASIDECLIATFEHCGDSIDIDRELVSVGAEEPNIDKFPNWLSPLLPKTKCLVGRHMARNEISSDWSQRLEPTITGRARVLFCSPENAKKSEVVLQERIGPPNRYSDLPDITAELLAMKHLNQTGSHQLHGGAPFRSSDLHSRPDFAGVKSDPLISNQAIPTEIPSHDNLVGHHPPRPYMAGMGRFLTAARLQEQINGEHPYGYALNNPVNYSDPSGMQAASTTSPHPLPPPWFPAEPTPVPPPVPILPVCIILCGVVACYEICTYTPCHPTGPFTRVGQCIGNWLFPDPIGDPDPLPGPKPRPGWPRPFPRPVPFPFPISDPGPRPPHWDDCDTHYNQCQGKRRPGAPPWEAVCFQCRERCRSNGSWPLDWNCNYPFW